MTTTMTTTKAKNTLMKSHQASLSSSKNAVLSLCDSVLAYPDYGSIQNLLLQIDNMKDIVAKMANLFESKQPE